jgi:hypothetical protein
LPSTDNRYDFVAKIANTNPDFVAAKVALQLVGSDNTILAEKIGFIYPQAEKYFAFFAQPSANANATLRIAGAGWQRYRNFKNFSQSRLQLTVSDADFSSAVYQSQSKLPGNVLTFKITNNTAYSYWQVGVYAVLLSGQRAAAAGYIALDQFRSGEVRDVTMTWSESLPVIDNYEILPEVNILDSASYMSVEQ